MATLQDGGGYYTSYTGIKPKHGGRPSVRHIDGTSAIYRDDLIENWEIVKKGREAMHQLSQLISQPTKNAHKTIQLFRKYSYDLIQYQFIFQDLIAMCGEEQDRLVNGNTDRSRKRWTPEEDEALIEYASHDNENATTIALKLGRSPGAIQTRISYLVGIEKLSTKVAGRFVGWIDGEEVEAEIDGYVSKN